MSYDVRASGRVKFETESTMRSTFDDAVEGLEECNEYLLKVLKKYTIRKNDEIIINIYENLSSEDRLWLVEWVDDILENASQGYINYWSDELGDKFLRMTTDGEEREIEGDFPVENI